jgi:predicted nuclease of predicted toxin-antitoxin system
LAIGKERRGTIITKDEDFHALSIRQRNIPPQVVWVRIGNCRKLVLLEAFTKLLPELLTAVKAGEAIVEIR